MSRTVVPAAIAELMAFPHWVCWRYEAREDHKPTKVPYTVIGRHASSTDPATWHPYDVAAASVPDFDGLGFVITDTPYVGVDLDHCLDPDTRTLAPWAQAIVDRLQSYTEVTPSRCGVRVWLRGPLPGSGHKKGGLGPDRTGAVEMYADGRFFTITGDHLSGTPETIEARDAEVATLYREFWPPARELTVERIVSVDVDDEALLDHARGAANGEKFTRLFDHGDTTGYPSPSEADLALCTLLAFWTGPDAARVARLFQRSKLLRPKWAERHTGDGRTYGEMTVHKAVSSVAEAYMGNDISAGAVRTNECDPVFETAPDPYAFTPAFPPDHFVSQVIAYAATRTDAAHEYHEATGLVLLSSGTPTLRAQLAQYPAGLPTNLYVMLVGDSTTSRKSTAKNIGRDLQQRVIPDSLLADQASPEAFIEQLARRSGDSSTWYVDEIGETVEKIHHAKYMAGLRGLLLQGYEGGDYHYQRTTKRTKSGALIRDELRVHRMHLSILGATTPTIFELLSGRDVESGFLGRFSIVMPSEKPPRRPFHEIGEGVEALRLILSKRLHDIYVWAKGPGRRVTFAPDTLDRIDRFAAELECAAATADERGKAMLQRLTATTVKLSVLAAAGRPNTLSPTGLVVTLDDADCAIRVGRRWQGYALAFAARVGENVFEKTLDRCLRHARQLAKAGRVRRRQVAMNAHVPKRLLDDIQATLADRGRIRVAAEEGHSGADTVIWEILQ